MALISIAPLILAGFLGVTSPGTELKARPSKVAEPAPTCGVKVVAYRFTGMPGSQFSYNGRAHTIRPSGFIEIVASRGVGTWELAGTSHTIGNAVADELGIVTIDVDRRMTVDAVRTRTTVTTQTQSESRLGSLK